MAELGKVKSVAAYGIEAYLLEIEVYVTKGQLPSTVVIGLPDAAVKECAGTGFVTLKIGEYYTYLMQPSKSS